MHPRLRTAARTAATLLGIVVAGYLFVRCINAIAGRGEPGVVQVMIVPGDGGAPVVALVASHTSRGRHTTRSYQLYAYDLATGAARGELALGGGDPSADLTLFPRAGALAWAVTPSGRVELLDLAHARVAASNGDLVRAAPELAGGYQVDTGSVTPYDPPMRALPVELHDGRRAWIDGAGATPALVDAAPPAPPWVPGYFCGPDDGQKPSCERTACLGFAPRPKTSALVLGVAPAWPAHTPIAPIGPAATPLLRPGLIARVDSPCAFETDGGVLVLHDSAALAPKASLLSLVGGDGVVRWTVPLAALTDHDDALALGATRLRDTIYVLLSDDHRTLELAAVTAGGRVLARRVLFD